MPDFLLVLYGTSLATIEILPTRKSSHNSAGICTAKYWEGSSLFLGNRNGKVGNISTTTKDRRV